MSKQYATSVYSQKSVTSAKSGRSYLSLRWSKPAIEDEVDETKSITMWQSLKTWLPEQNKKKSDQASIITRSSTTSSIGKLKNLFSLKKKASILTQDSSSPRTSLDNTIEESDEDRPKQMQHPTGILIHSLDEEERQKRKMLRKKNIIKLQSQNGRIHYHPSFKLKTIDDPLFHPSEFSVSSSSSDTLFTPDSVDPKPKKTVGFSTSDDDGIYNPRIMFIEPSPVPRFRNVAPPPPPSPLYLDIIVHSALHDVHIKSPMTDEDEPTVFSQTLEPKNQDDYFYPPHLLFRQPSKPKVYFEPPYHRGQTIQFSLKNMIPEDHIILFKFLTTTTASKNEPERYFVRPSAGKIDQEDEANILLFLNQVPAYPTKDRIMVRWAAIQKNSVIENWVHTLHESSRRKWLDMLDEQWPDQVNIQMTRIKIRFK